MLVKGRPNDRNTTDVCLFFSSPFFMHWPSMHRYVHSDAWKLVNPKYYAIIISKKNTCMFMTGRCLWYISALILYSVKHYDDVLGHIHVHALQARRLGLAAVIKARGLFGWISYTGTHITVIFINCKYFKRLLVIKVQQSIAWLVVKRISSTNSPKTFHCKFQSCNVISWPDIAGYKRERAHISVFTATLNMQHLHSYTSLIFLNFIAWLYRLMDNPYTIPNTPSTMCGLLFGTFIPIIKCLTSFSPSLTL